MDLSSLIDSKQNWVLAEVLGNCFLVSLKELRGVSLALVVLLGENSYDFEDPVD